MVASPREKIEYEYKKKKKKIESKRWVKVGKILKLPHTTRGQCFLSWQLAFCQRW